MNIVDYIILGIIGLNIIYGLYRGFIQSLLSLGGSILAVFASFLYFPKVVDFIAQQTDIISSLSYFTGAETLLKNVPAAGQSVQSINSAGIMAALDQLQLAKPLDIILAQNIRQQSFRSATQLTLGDYVAQTVISVSIHIIAFIACYFLAFSLISIVLNLLKGIFRFPALRHADALAGGLLGALRGVIFVLIIFTLSPLLQTIVPIEEFRLLLNQSQFAPYFQNGNFIINILQRKF